MASVLLPHGFLPQSLVIRTLGRCPDSSLKRHISSRLEPPCRRVGEWGGRRWMSAGDDAGGSGAIFCKFRQTDRRWTGGSVQTATTQCTALCFLLFVSLRKESGKGERRERGPGLEEGKSGKLSRLERGPLAPQLQVSK